MHAALVVYVILTQARDTGEEGASVKKSLPKSDCRQVCKALSSLVIGGGGAIPELGFSSGCLPPWLDLEPQSAAFEKDTDQETQSLSVTCHREADGKCVQEEAGFTVRRTKF